MHAFRSAGSTLVVVVVSVYLFCALPLCLPFSFSLPFIPDIRYPFFQPLHTHSRQTNKRIHVYQMYLQSFSIHSPFLLLPSFLRSTFPSRLSSLSSLRLSFLVPCISVYQRRHWLNAYHRQRAKQARGVRATAMGRIAPFALRRAHWEHWDVGRWMGCRDAYGTSLAVVRSPICRFHSLLSVSFFVRRFPFHYHLISSFSRFAFRGPFHCFLISPSPCFPFLFPIVSFPFVFPFRLPFSLVRFRFPLFPSSLFRFPVSIFLIRSGQFRA